jgi:hypothetical protein
VVAPNEFDNLYLSKGVLLEAQLIAHDLEEQRQNVPLKRVIQVFRAGDVGSQAAEDLAAALAGDDFTIVNRTLGVNQPPRADKAARELAAALRDARAGDVLVLWLRAGDVATLGPVPAELSMAYMSGRMSGLERSPLPAAWRSATRIAYPFDLPERRRVRVDYPLGWFSIRKIPVVAQQAQTDTWLACGIVSDAINHMADTFVRDYLVERIEEMLEHRIVTGYYPRLALAPGQRFASKGGYLVRFAEPSGHKVVALGDWITP